MALVKMIKCEDLPVKAVLHNKKWITPEKYGEIIKQEKEHRQYQLIDGNNNVDGNKTMKIIGKAKPKPHCNGAYANEER